MRVLFVCTGNICRSPTADGIMRKLVQDAGRSDIEVDSAGTSAYHAGHPADARMQEAAKMAGYDLSDLRARQVQLSDYYEFDVILAMDKGHLIQLQEARPHNATATVRMFMEQDVPDPYYGGQDGFTNVLKMVEAGCQRLLTEL